MKTTLKIIGLSLAILFAVTITNAQRSGNSGEMKDPATMAQKQTERMTEHLSLTSAQQVQVSTINLAYAEQISAAKTNGQDRDAIKSIRNEQKSAIKAVLTADQIATLEERKGKKGRKGGKSRGNSTSDRTLESTPNYSGNVVNNNSYTINQPRLVKGGSTTTNVYNDSSSKGEDRIARLTEKLGLSLAQVYQITAINDSFKARRDAIKNSGDKESIKEAMKSLRTEHSTAVKTVLTSEQIALFEELKNSREGKGKRGKGRR